MHRMKDNDRMVVTDTDGMLTGTCVDETILGLKYNWHEQNKCAPYNRLVFKIPTLFSVSLTSYTDVLREHAPKSS
jgi:hypothetical protein